MKKIALLAALVFFIGFLTKPVRAEDWQEYTDNTYQVKISYPQDWVRNERSVISNICDLRSPKKDALDVFQEYVAMKAKEMPDLPINLNQIVRFTIREIKRTKEPRGKVLISESMTFAGLPAHRLVYTRIYDGMTVIKYQQIIFLKDKILYTVSYGAEMKEYDNYLPLVQEIVDSIQFVQ